MENNTKEVVVETKEFKVDKKMWQNSLKMTGKILLSVVFVFFYLISVLFFCAPNFDAKIFNFFGFTKAEEACYVRAYEKSNNIDDHKMQSTMYELCKSYIILGARLMQDELFKNGYYEAKENID